MAEQMEMSKSAKARAAKKVRDAAHESENPPAPAVPVAQPKAKGKAKAQAEPAKAPEPAPKAKAKAKAKAQAEPAKAPEPEPKAKAKAKAKAQAEPAKAPEPEPKAKAKAKAKAQAEPVKAPEPEPKTKAKKAKAPKPEEEPAAKPKQVEEANPSVSIDDGTGGDWEDAAALNKKSTKRKEKVGQEAVAPAPSAKVVPGMAPNGKIPSTAAAAKSNSNQISCLTVDDILANLASGSARVAAAAKAAAAEENAATKELEANLSTATISVPEAKIGRIIGPKGANIKLIQEKTGVTRIDTSGEVFVVTGPPEAVALAEMAIKELIAKGYMSLAYDDFKEDSVAVHPSNFPNIIGKQGVVIRKIKEELGVEVGIPDAPRDSPPGKKFKVSLAGASEKVDLAIQVINDIVMYSHHEITHPGMVHVEMEVPDWAYSFVIGRAGSELRHIQNNYKVIVNIPRETSECQQVLVIGEEEGVQRAKAYIEKLLVTSEEASKGRDKPDTQATDHWGDDNEPQEDWMKSYMYKR
ncbi:unnamed protein product [Polarella glacialis]|uniref:K Homology domain-containing protein n=1 Tax=Polarella glacialis TaxID=89957 RepID=A0A813KMY8_POLGL|nr:unnamed protein product [Polarella glacialis]